MQPVLIAACSAAVIMWTASVTLSDIARRRIPNHLVVVGLILATVCATTSARLLPAIIGGISLFVFYLATKILGGAIGGGDIKTAAPIGMVAGVGGFSVWLGTSLGAFLITALAGIASLPIKQKLTAEQRQPRWIFTPNCLPHGASMALCSAVAVIVTWFLG